MSVTGKFPCRTRSKPEMKVCSNKTCYEFITSTNKRAKKCNKHLRIRPKCRHGVIARRCKMMECVTNPIVKSIMCVHDGVVTRKRGM